MTNFTLLNSHDSFFIVNYTLTFLAADVLVSLFFSDSCPRFPLIKLKNREGFCGGAAAPGGAVLIETLLRSLLVFKLPLFLPPAEFRRCWTPLSELHRLSSRC